MTDREIKNKENHTQAGDYSPSLSPLRGEIDRIDERILALINQRLEIGKKVGEIKKQTGSQILNRTRERMVIERLSQLNSGPADESLIQYIFNVIITATREIQRPKSVGFLGPLASHSHIAALHYFRHCATFIEEPSFFDIFHNIERKQLHFGIVPVENSIEGAVNYTLDLFAEFDIQITAEHYEPVSHDLLSITGELKDVKSVYSHPQAIAQCKNWLKKHLPHAIVMETTSTSNAAIMASKDEQIAAIASEKAAHFYNLLPVASKIQDRTGNITRFLVIGGDGSERTGNDKTSVMFATNHTPGALFRALSPVNRSGLNMVKLESRPTRNHNWSYHFFMDIEGHIQDEIVFQTIEQIRSQALYLKVLGAYPIFEKQEILQ
ncbi:MAG: prephenate dehydratase [Desulfobacter postgatei]|uniref:Bifunctional chorismate mutase/prephenate dehydratase n=1 Tax=Desulfobacter postgatei TaxID=2293 RepID=A0A2G6MQ56_9BACT|nr:MAG: prephenate dehydratase [Desulfobacter postgatei]